MRYIHAPFPKHVIVVTLITVFLAGASGFVFGALHSLLIFGALLLSVTIIASWIWRPIWALYMTLFIVLLPTGLLPAVLQSYLNRLLTILAVGVWLFEVASENRKIKVTGAMLAMSGFIGWGLITLLWTQKQDVSLTILQTYILRLVLFLLVLPHQIFTISRLSGLMAVLTFQGFVIVALCIGSLLLVGYTPGTRFQLFDINENDLGVSLLITLPGALWLALQSSGQFQGIKRMAGVVYVFIALGLVALSGSRGGAISVAATLAMFCVWKPTRFIAMYCGVVMIAAVFLMPALFMTLLERFMVASGDTLLGGREVIWSAALQLISKNPFFGVGIGNAPYEISPYLYNVHFSWDYDWIAIHNPILAIWAETGLPGLFLYLSALCGAVWNFLYSWIRSPQPELQAYRMLVFAVFVGLLLSWVKGGGAETSFTYFFGLGLLLIPSYMETRKS